jgi:4-amino-4-deoxy-L-arabinose transferase-like glycosyltransferase
MTARTEALLVTAACLVLYLTGLGDVPFHTRGEPREGLVVQEMQRTGSWLVPMRADGVPARKPPAYYWAASLAFAALPARPELALRLPSALLATLAVLVTWLVVRRTVDPLAALPAALVLATSFEWTRAAVSARVDMTLAAALAGVFGALAAALAREEGSPTTRTTLLGAAAMAAAVLVKGPVGIVLPCAAVLALAGLRRDPRLPLRLRLPHMVGLAAVLCGLWYLAAWARLGPAFVDVVLRENVGRFVDTGAADTGHAHGPLYLLGLGLVGLLPWTPLLPLLASPFRSPAPRPPIAFAAVWSVVVVVFFSLATSKRSVYLLPAFPAIALLLGAGTVHPPAGRLARAVRMAAGLYVPGLVLLAAGATALALGVDVARLVTPWLRDADARAAAAVGAAASGAAIVIALVVGLSALGAVAIAHSRARERWRDLVLALACVAVVWIAAFDAVIHPAIGRTRSLAPFMRRVDALVAPDAVLHAFFPPDPALRFYAPRPVRRVRDGSAETARYLLLWEDEWRVWRDAGGRPLRALAVSDSRPSRRGALALVLAPPGTLRRGSTPPPAAAPGLRTAPDQNG